MTKDLLEQFLLGSTCDSKGELKLTLKAGKQLIQEGPFILPPIRWLDSFEQFAEFKIVCDVK
ncbi:hypothetical protein [Bartonella sp. CL26QHWL]|uniref:hypothetical protein n=1 Tax=Bartonella sp. CL26QHWL TaxID=3243520 RepID=UPI0035D11804